MREVVPYRIPLSPIERLLAARKRPTYITRCALVQRLNRILKPRSQRIVINRCRRCESEFGKYCLWDNTWKCVVRHHLDLVEVGHLLGALRRWEALLTP